MTIGFGNHDVSQPYHEADKYITFGYELTRNSGAHHAVCLISEVRAHGHVAELGALNH